MRYLSLPAILACCFVLGERAACAALNSTTVIEVEASGSDSNGGMYDPSVASGSGCSGSTDWTYGPGQQTKALTGTVTLASGVLTDSVSEFTPAMCGNTVQVPGNGFYTIKAYTSGTSVTVNAGANAAASISTGASGAIVGGALGTWGGLGAALNNAAISGMRVWIKTGTYSVTSATANIAGGALQEAVPENMEIAGYNATRGDLDVANPATANAPLIQAAVSSVSLFSNNPGYGGWTFRNLIFDCANESSSYGFNTTVRTFEIRNMLIKRCTAYGIYAAALVADSLRVTATSGSGSAIYLSGNSDLSRVEVDNNTTTGGMIVLYGADTTLRDILIHDDAGSSTSYGIDMNIPSGWSGQVENVTCYNLSSTCLYLYNNAGIVPFIGNIIAEYGTNYTSAKPILADSNTTNHVFIADGYVFYNTGVCSSNCILGANVTNDGPSVTTYSPSAFVSASGSNFALSGSAPMRFLPYTFGDGVSASYGSAGAVQGGMTSGSVQ